MKKEFDVYFSGEILDGFEVEQVKQAVGDLFRISGQKLEALFAGIPVRVKKNLSADKAGRFRKAFLESGALVQIVPAGQEPAAEEPLQRPSTPRASALPSQSAPGKSESPMPPGSGLALAPMEPLKTDPPPKEPAVDISSLKISDPAAESPSREEPPGQAPALPDISGLSMLPLEETGETEEQPETRAPLPDTSHLEALPPRSGSLDEFKAEKEPAPIPDTSKLSLKD